MKTVDSSRIDILAGLSTAKSQRIVPDSPVEEAGFELFVPLGISASTSWWSRAWKSCGMPEEGFSVAGPNGSNPSPSCTESANHRFLSVGAQSAGDVPKRRRSGRLLSRLHDTGLNQALGICT